MCSAHQARTEYGRHIAASQHRRDGHHVFSFRATGLLRQSRSGLARSLPRAARAAGTWQFRTGWFVIMKGDAGFKGGLNFSVHFPYLAPMGLAGKSIAECLL